MRTRSATTLIVILTILFISGIAFGLAKTAEGQAPFSSELSNFTPEAVQGFDGFPLYSLGPQFENLPLRAIVRVDREPLVQPRAGFGVPGNRTNHMNFIYGTCGGGCVPPLTVQVWPACDRTLQDYYYNVPGGGASRPYELITIRRVPAARFSGMLEIYTGRVTVVIFGQTAAQQERAAASLASANLLAGDISASDPLPPPVHGAIEGKLRC